MTDQESHYTKELQGKVIKTEEAYYKKRRQQAGKEFVAEKGKEAFDLPYVKALQDAGRRPVGLAFSGGGIRSATFNLGLAQGLSQFGILPWVDYLTSVSGGGFTASCLTSLLTYDEKRVASSEFHPASDMDAQHASLVNVEKPAAEKSQEIPDPEDAADSRYYPLNTQWERFPFNPALQVFDVNGIAYKTMGRLEMKEGLPMERAEELPLKPSDDKNRNKQLEHLRNMGDYLIPRKGLSTLDTMRALGAFLLRVAYTLSVFLAAMTMLAALHYAVTAAFTPEVLGSFEIKEADGTPSLFTLLFTAYNKTEPPLSYIPWDAYLAVLFSGAGFGLLLSLIVSFAYRKDVTTENRFRPWRSPSARLSTYAWVVTRGVMAVGASIALGLSCLTAVVWIRNASLAAAQGFFYYALAGLFAAYFLAALYLLFVHARSESWAASGLPESEWVDKLIARLVVLAALWTLTLLLAALRIGEGFDENTLRVYWIWMPALFLFGGGWGLILLQYIQDIPILQIIIKRFTTWRVHFPPEILYGAEAVHPLVRALLRFIHRIKKTEGGSFDRNNMRKSRGVGPFTASIWSNPDFRSMFWTLQGLFMYGTLAFLLLGLALIPHYFSILQGEETQVAVSLSAAVISGAWARYLAQPKSEGSKSWLAKILSLPSELRLTILTLLVLVFNLSVLYLLETALDMFMRAAPAPWTILIAAGGAAALLLTLGTININYLSAHYFFRDRIADAYLFTKVDDPETGQAGIPRDHRDRPLSRIAQDNCSAPYHIIQTTLNLAGSWFLQFKDRKSQPFMMSKDYCGSEATGYAPTSVYRDNYTKYSQAVAISGAAVSSGLGSLTSFAYAFFITLFNLRLGLWMANPNRYAPQRNRQNPSKASPSAATRESPDAQKKEKNSSPEKNVFWLPYLLEEMIGRIHERGKLVNLTDGAHTDDNIGLYPLFQRRCQFILAGDAGEDPRGECKNLMAVIRQANIDFGVEVDIDVEALKPGEYDQEKKTSTESRAHFAVGRITYAGPGDSKSSEGWLIYFRPAVVKGDPAPLLKYWEQHKLDFPHPTTADQFFDEEQFEVQRLLGKWTVVSALKTIREEMVKTKDRQKSKTGKARLGSYIRFLDDLIQPDQEGIPEKFKVPAWDTPQKTRKPVRLEDILSEYHKAVSHAVQPA